MARKHHNDRDSHAGPSQRALRVGELIRHALAEMLTRGEISDPDLARHVVTIPKVKMSPDALLTRHTLLCADAIDTVPSTAINAPNNTPPNA